MKKVIFNISIINCVFIILYAIGSHKVLNKWLSILFFISLIIVFVIAIIDIVKFLDNNSQEKINAYREQLRINYHSALESGDKRQAIICGREYYASHNIYDEQRIQNDLLCFLNTK